MVFELTNSVVQELGYPRWTWMWTEHFTVISVRGITEFKFNPRREPEIKEDTNLYQYIAGQIQKSGYRGRIEVVYGQH